MLYLKLVFLAALVSSCMGHNQERTREDLFNVQTRLLALEQRVLKGGELNQQVGSTTQKGLASVNVEVANLNRDLMMLKGDVDGLKTGVKTGKLPGSPEEEESIAKTILELSQRIQAVEGTQAKILEIMEKGSSKGASRTPLKDLKAVEHAFNGKKYKYIVEDVPLILSGKKGHELHMLRYFFSESLFKIGRLREAALSFDELLRNNKLPSYKAQIQLRMGDCFRHLGDSKAALVYYNELVENFPKAKEADKAREYIDRLKGKG